MEGRDKEQRDELNNLINGTGATGSSAVREMDDMRREIEAGPAGDREIVDLPPMTLNLSGEGMESQGEPLRDLEAEALIARIKPNR